ncbi:MAG: hypothetical protein ABW032_05175 [Burkholderiaceae bacterium]
MKPNPDPLIPGPCFELLFTPLHAAWNCITVPCDESGAVDLDELDSKNRELYFYAHTLIGRDFARPLVHRKEASISAE